MRTILFAACLAVLAACSQPANVVSNDSDPAPSTGEPAAHIHVHAASVSNPIGTWSGGATYQNLTVHATWQLLPGGIANNIVTDGQPLHDTKWEWNGDQLKITAFSAGGSRLELVGTIDGDQWTGYASVFNGETLSNSGELRYSRVAEH